MIDEKLHRKDDRIITKCWIIFLALLALHNTEEVIYGMPVWGKSHGYFDVWTQNSFLAATIIVWLITFAVMWFMRQSKRWYHLSLIIASGIMAINGVQHIFMSIITQSFMPGIVMSPLLVALGLYLVLQSMKFSERGKQSGKGGER